MDMLEHHFLMTRSAWLLEPSCFNTPFKAKSMWVICNHGGLDKEKGTCEAL